MRHDPGFGRMRKEAHRGGSPATASTNGNGQRTSAHASYGAFAKGTALRFAVARHPRGDAGKAASASTPAAYTPAY